VRQSTETMLDVLLTVLLVALVAFMVGAVWTGRWSRTWVGSGRAVSGRRYPGGPTGH